MIVSIRNGLVAAAFLAPVYAFAQSADCGKEVERAINNCNSRISYAKNTDVSPFNSGSGVPDAGTVQATAARMVSVNIGKASDNCQTQDLNLCLKSCNAALKSSPALFAKIKSNMNKCNDKIEGLRAAADASRAGLEKAAVESTEVANQANDRPEREPSYAGTAPDGTKVETVADHWIGFVDGRPVVQSTYVPATAAADVMSNWKATYGPNIQIQVIPGGGH